MNDVKVYVEKLFSGYPTTTQNLDLREEVISNLEAEIEDMQRHGISYEEAFRTCTKRMGSLQGLVEEVKTVQWYSLVSSMMQWALIYLIIGWIVAIPFSMYPWIRMDSWVFFFVILMIGILYLILVACKRVVLRYRMSINLSKVVKFQKLTWIIWIIFMAFSWLKLSGLLFGSNIWFARPLSLSGPYEFAGVVSRYMSPAFTIIIPLLINKLKTTIDKEESQENE